MGNAEKNEEVITTPMVLDNKTLDLVSYIRGQGYSASEITLASLIADPEITCRNRKQYQAKLKSLHGVEIPYPRICELFRDERFMRCVDMIYSVEEGHLLRAVWKNMYRRAADPDDPHAVAAANLIFKAKKILEKSKPGSEGGTDVNSYSEFIKQFRQAQREGGKVTVRERSVTFDATPEKVLPESGSQSSEVIEGNFRTEPQRLQSEDQEERDLPEPDPDPGP